MVKLIADLYKGKVKENTPVDLYLQTADDLTKGVNDNWRIKTTDITWDSPDNLLIEKLRENIYQFSGAKTRVQLKEYNKILKDAAGKLVSFNIFKSKALEVDKKYNINYLNAEYKNAVASGQNAANWLRYQDNKDLFPNLEYDAILDERTRPEHLSLDGIIKPLDDVFWNTHYPPNGWGCRCDVLQTDKKPKGSVGKSSDGAVQSGFKNNVGKTGKVFTNDHPYNKADKTQPKSKDYGLSPTKDKYKGLNNSLPQNKAAFKTSKEFEAWWNEMVKKSPAGELGFTMFDKNNFKAILFSNKLKAELLKKGFEEASNIPDLISNPDEVYMPDNSTTIYIKYLANNPIILTTKSDDKYITCKSIKNSSINATDELRTGTLIYLKQ